MKSIWFWLVLAFFVYAPFGYGPNIYADLTHPEIWDLDWRHDPRLYLPPLIVSLMLTAAIGTWAAVMDWREARHLRQLKRIREAVRLCGGSPNK